MVGLKIGQGQGRGNSSGFKICLMNSDGSTGVYVAYFGARTTEVSSNGTIEELQHHA